MPKGINPRDYAGDPDGLMRALEEEKASRGKGKDGHGGKDDPDPGYKPTGRGNDDRGRRRPPEEATGSQPPAPPGPQTNITVRRPAGAMPLPVGKEKEVSMDQPVRPNNYAKRLGSQPQREMSPFLAALIAARNGEKPDLSGLDNQGKLNLVRRLVNEALSKGGKLDLEAVLAVARAGGTVTVTNEKTGVTYRINLVSMVRNAEVLGNAIAASKLSLNELRAAGLVQLKAKTLENGETIAWAEYYCGLNDLTKGAAKLRDMGYVEAVELLEEHLLKVEDRRTLANTKHQAQRAIEEARAAAAAAQNAQTVTGTSEDTPPKE